MAQETPEATASPTTPPFVPSPTPGDPVDAFESVFARFEASTLSPLTGQPFTLILAVTLPVGLEITAWPVIEGAWGPFEIRQVGEITHQGSELRQSFTAVLWRPEDVVTPETFVGYGAGGGDLRRVPVRRAFFSVPSVIDPDDENLRPPRSPYLTAWPWPVLIVLTCIAAAVIVTVAARWPQPPPEPPADPLQIALGRLRALKKRPAPQQLQAAVAILRDLNAAASHVALDAAITTGEALAYTGHPVPVEDAAAFLELAARAVREAGR